MVKEDAGDDTKVAPELPVAQRGLTSWILSGPVLLRVAAVLVFVVYLKTVGFDFVFDDHLQISLNPWLSSWKYVPIFFHKQLWGFTAYYTTANYYRPVFMLWLFLVQQVTGGAPGWFHLCTIGLHLVVVYQVYALTRLLMKNETVAGIAALLFGLHPTKVETVAWISGGSEPLEAMFLFGTLICYLHAREGVRRKAWMAGAIVFFLGALFAKETAILVPLMMAVYEFYASSEKRYRRLWAAIRPAIPYFALSGVYWAIRWHVMHGLSEMSYMLSIPKTIWTLPEACWFYILHTVWPFRLSEYYPLMIEWNFSVKYTLLPAIPLIALGWIGWRYARRSPEWALLATMYVLSLAPVIATVLLIQPHDRYLYVPTYPAAVLAATMICKLRWRDERTSGALRVGVVTALVAVFIAGTVVQFRWWDNDLALMKRAVEIAPNHIPARVILAGAYSENGEMGKAMAILHETVQQFPDSQRAWEALGIQEYLNGDIKDAKVTLLESLKKPTDELNKTMSIYYLGMIAYDTGHYEDAVRWYTLAIGMRPKSGGFHTSLALALDKLGRHEEAKQARAIERRIDNFQSQ